MSWRNTEIRYGWLSIGLHWLMLFLIVAIYAAIELREIYPKGSDPREALKTWHFMLGLSCLALVFVRLAVRAGARHPAITPALPQWQQRIGSVMHVALYALMIGMPIAGWLLRSAAGKPIPFFGLELPPLIAADKSTAEILEEAHKTAGTVGYFIIGFHALAALYHHYVRRDTTLRRMLPGG